MQIQNILLTLSTIMVVISPITYIVSIFQGKSKPHKVTRFILAIALTLNFVSVIAANGNMGAKIYAGIVFAQGIIVFILSLWHGMGGSSIFDFACLAIAGIGVVGWKITGNPIIGIWFATLADLAAYLPAFVKTWKHPHTESPWYYIIGGLAAYLSLIAYKIDISSIFQIWIILCCVIMVVLIYRKSLRKLFT